MPLLRVDLSPSDYIHVPQAPRIERREIFRREGDNPWQMMGVVGVGADGACLGLSNHTWSHVDAPFHLLGDGASLDQIPPAQYLANRARVVDLTAAAKPRRSAPEMSPEAREGGRRETIDGVDYHSLIDADDLPSDLDACDALLFVTGFGALIDRGYPMRPDADYHYPSISADAAARLAAAPRLKLVALDSPTIDKPEANAVAHRTLLSRRPTPVLIVETLTCERLRRAVPALPREVILTIEPLRAFGPHPDGALASVYAWAAPSNRERAEFDAFATTVTGATLAT
jgi:kynurenine formamidase